MLIPEQIDEGFLLSGLFFLLLSFVLDQFSQAFIVIVIDRS